MKCYWSKHYWALLELSKKVSSETLEVKCMCPQAHRLLLDLASVRVLQSYGGLLWENNTSITILKRVDIETKQSFSNA